MTWIDVRCDSHLRAGWCNRLLFRRTPDLQGTIEVKCGKCAQVKEIRFQPSYNFST